MDGRDGQLVQKGKIGMELSNAVAFISYDSGDEGSVTSEWVKDKIKGLLELGFSVTLVTSAGSKLETQGRLKVVKVRSLSRRDRLGEIQRRGNNEMLGSLPRLLGGTFDFVFKSIAGNISHGKWSWVLMSLPVIVRILRQSNFAHIVATGGPSSAHVATVAACKFVERKPILEFQDPFVPTMAKMSRFASLFMGFLEKWMIKNCKKMVFVSNEAAKTVQSKHQEFRNRIVSCLPGSPVLITETSEKAENKGDKLVFTHLGTLYSSRNFKNTHLALKKAISAGEIEPHELVFRNIGQDNSPALHVYQETFFEQYPTKPRIEGLSFARKSHFLVLIQHTDDRSIETIPYKTYDYLNLQKPILGLVRNRELRELILSHGGVVADPRKPNEIRMALVELVSRARSKRIIASESKITALDQVKKLLDIP